jgi:hypothetical protein
VHSTFTKSSAFQPIEQVQNGPVREVQSRDASHSRLAIALRKRRVVGILSASSGWGVPRVTVSSDGPLNCYTCCLAGLEGTGMPSWRCCHQHVQFVEGATLDGCNITKRRTVT